MGAHVRTVAPILAAAVIALGVGSVPATPTGHSAVRPLALPRDACAAPAGAYAYLTPAPDVLAWLAAGAPDATPPPPLVEPGAPEGIGVAVVWDDAVTHSVTITVSGRAAGAAGGPRPTRLSRPFRTGPSGGPARSSRPRRPRR